MMSDAERPMPTRHAATEPCCAWTCRECGARNYTETEAYVPKSPEEYQAIAKKLLGIEEWEALSDGYGELHVDLFRALPEEAACSSCGVLHSLDHSVGRSSASEIFGDEEEGEEDADTEEESQ